jgi:hypothetical protein
MIKRFLLSLFIASLVYVDAAFFPGIAAGQTVMQGQVTAGSGTTPPVRVPVKVDASGNLGVMGSTTATDPCASSGVAKASAAINITTAATTALVAPSAGLTVYVCSFSMTISQVVTTANTIKFVRGTGATCGTGTADLTGAFGTGGVTAAPPIVVASGAGNTQFKGSSGDGVCATTTIGASAAFVGVLTYVQQ